MKRCSKCGEEKALTGFQFDEGRYRAACRVCSNAQRRARYTPERRRAEYLREKAKPGFMAKVVERVIRWRDRNPERLGVQRAKHRERRREHRRMYERLRRALNPEWAREKSRLQYERQRRNPSYLSWNKRNREKRREYERKWNASQVSNLGNSYVQNKIRRTMGIVGGNIPAAVVEAKREHLKVIRLLKEKSR